MMLIQQTLIQYLLQKKNLCEIFKVLTIWGNINLFIRPQHHPNHLSNLNENDIYIKKDKILCIADQYGFKKELGFIESD